MEGVGEDTDAGDDREAGDDRGAGDGAGAGDGTDAGDAKGVGDDTDAGVVEGMGGVEGVEGVVGVEGVEGVDGVWKAVEASADARATLCGGLAAFPTNTSSRESAPLMRNSLSSKVVPLRRVSVCTANATSTPLPILKPPRIESSSLSETGGFPNGDAKALAPPGKMPVTPSRRRAARRYITNPGRRACSAPGPGR